MGEEELARHSLFGGVEEGAVEALLAHTQWVEAERGQVIYRPQSFRRCLGVLLKGRIQVRREQLLVSCLEEGDLFGAAALFQPGDSYPTTLTALTDCRLALIAQEGVEELICRSGAFALNYVAYLSDRIRFLSARLDTVSASGGEGKLAQYLLTADDGTGRVTLSATQLCQRIGVGRATLYRAFEALEEVGAIGREGKTICITDREKLRACGNTHQGKEMG